MENFDAFDWDSMKEQVGSDPFAENTRKFEEDKRFYRLSKDDKGNGAAIIRFLPDKDRLTIQKVNKINTTIIKNGKKRFVNEWSPSTIGKPCPFQEKWAELWNAGLKEEAKRYSRGVRYIANIKVINDPVKPENNGKIFLLDMSGSLSNKLKEALEPTDTQLALGEKPKQLFNPLKGYNFKLVTHIGSNGIQSYDNSSSVGDECSIYNSVEEAVNDIKENTHSLAEFVAEESFLPYDELKNKLKWVMWEDAPAVQEVSEPAAAVETTPTVVETIPELNQTPEPVTATATTQATSNTDLDAILNELKQ